MESSGTLAGTLKFYRGAITDVNTLAPAFNLSDAITVKVDAAAVTAVQTVDPTCTAGAGTVAFPAGPAPILRRDRALGTADVVRRCDDERRRRPPATQRVAYRLTWPFPSTANDNSYQARLDQGRPELGDPVIPSAVIAVMA